MEISEFLRLTRRRIVGLFLLTLLVATPVALLLVSRSPTYQATATVDLHALASATAADDEQARVGADLSEALDASSVLGAASAASGIPASRLTNEIGYTPPDQGFLATVTLTDHDRLAAQVAVRSVASAAVGLLARQGVSEADQARAIADRAAVKAASAVASLQPGPLGGTARSDQLAQALLELRTTGAVDVRPADLVAAVDSETAGDPASMASDPVYLEREQQLRAALDALTTATAADMAADATLTAVSAPTYVMPVEDPIQIGHSKLAAVGGFGAGASVTLLVILALALRRSREPGTVSASPQPGGPAPPSVGQPGRLLAPMSESPLLRAGTRLARREGAAAAALIVLVPLAVALAIAFAHLAGEKKATLAILLAVPVGLASAILAVRRFEVFLLFLIAVRTSLDAFNVNTLGKGGGIDPGAALGAVFIVAAALWLAAQRRSPEWRPMSSMTRWLWAFAGACLLSCIGSVDPVLSAETAAKVVAGVLMFAVIEQYLGRHPEAVGRLVAAVIASVLLPIGMGLHQWVFNNGTKYYVDVSRVSGTFPHPSSLATYLLIVVPLLLLLVGEHTGWRRTGLLTLSGVLIALMFLTYTRTAYVAAFGMAVYLGVRWRRQVLGILAALIVVLLVAVPSFSSRFADLHTTNQQVDLQTAPPNSLSWRFEYWKLVLPLAKDNPVTGIGFGMVAHIEPEALPPHNGFIEALVETGVVGLVTITGILVSLARYLRRRLAAATTKRERNLALAAMATAIGLIIQFPFENLLDQTAIYWYTAVAMTFGYPMAAAARRATSGEAPVGWDLEGQFAELLPDDQLVGA